MRIVRYLPILPLFTGCATGSNLASPAGPAKVNPASIAANPAAFDGRNVEVVGLVSFEAEHHGLHQSYGAYCRGGEKTAIYVDWTKWPGVTRADNRREVVVRGTFRNLQGNAQPNGAVLVSNAAPGPGPLEPGGVVRWLSRPAKACPRTMP